MIGTSPLVLAPLACATNHGVDYTDESWQERVDLDEGGYSMLEDCDDRDAESYPRAAEHEPLDVCVTDADGWGDDGDASIHPGAGESCDLTDDCDGAVDEGAAFCEGAENGLYELHLLAGGRGHDHYSAAGLGHGAVAALRGRCRRAPTRC